MTQNYFFIDGSALLAQIRKLQKQNSDFKNRKLDPIKFIEYFSLNLIDLEADSYKRAVFYFPDGETTIFNYLLEVEFREPGVGRDIQFKFCGEKLEKAEEWNRFVEEKVPPEWKDRCQKSEKGIDIEICCDAFRLAANGKLERLLLLTSDRDFIPLFRALKDFGVNISLLHLSSATSLSDSLRKECDTYDVVSEEALNRMFFPLLQTPPTETPRLEPPENIKNSP